MRLKINNFIVIMTLLLGLSLRPIFTAAESFEETGFFLGYFMMWIILLSFCWMFLANLQEERWWREKGL